MAKTPPDILITTPESLYLMLSSNVREILATTEAVIVDEIHAVAQTKRGAHLALTLERLDDLVQAHGGEGSGEDSAEQQRGGSSEPSPNGLLTGGWSRDPADRALRHAAAAGADCSVPGRVRSASARSSMPGGPRSSTWRSSCRWRTWRTRERLLIRARTASPRSEIEPSAHVRSIWPAIYPKLLELVQEHTSTIIFVNNRRASERLAKRLNELANGEGEQELPATEHGGHAALGGGPRGGTGPSRGA